MNVKFFLTAICAIGTISTIHGYHILCIFSIPTSSQNLLGKGMVNALLKANHEVTWVTSFPPKTTRKGLHIIDASSAILPVSQNVKDTNYKIGLAFLREFTTNSSLALIGIPALREALVKNNYDAVITVALPGDVSAGFAAIQQAPWLLLSTVVLQPFTAALVDEVRTLATIPMYFNDYPIPMSFKQRLYNTAVYAIMAFDSWWHKDATLALYDTMFAPLAAARGVPLTRFDEALNNASILFVNSHPSISPAQSFAPNVVEIGGFHIEEHIEPAPKDIQAILDSSTNGVVYFSMGSIVKSASLPAETKKDLLKLLGELPYTVLWKFEEELNDLPKNVHIKPWMPQTAILAHNNTKLFITHTGLLSMTEAVYFGVPLVAVPVVTDQIANAAQAARSGFAVKVEFDVDKMADNLRPALKEILSNDSYYKKAKYLSLLFRKRPVSHSQLISHYVELAIESKGAYHLRSKANLYPFYQRWMLDQVAFILVILYIVLTLVSFILKLVIRIMSGKKETVKFKTN